MIGGAGRTRRWVGACVAAGVCVAAGACADAEEPPLSAAERETVAKAYADSVRALTAPTDSACAADRPTLVAHLTDSIYNLRLADIEAQQRVVQ